LFPEHLQAAQHTEKSGQGRARAIGEILSTSPRSLVLPSRKDATGALIQIKASLSFEAQEVVRRSQ
jgi:hypothetical protein